MPEFLSQAKKSKLSQDGIDSIVNTLKNDPLVGDIIKETAGTRKLRHAGHGSGRSGGYRTTHYFGGLDMPVFILTVYRKGDKANPTKAKQSNWHRFCLNWRTIIVKRLKQWPRNGAAENIKGTGHEYIQEFDKKR